MNPDGGMLRGIGIFQDLGADELDDVARRMSVRRCRRGELLCREGDPGSEMYVIASGSVAVTVTPKDGAEITLTRIPSGAFFGEMCIIESAPRSATCRAEEDCEFLALHADAFHDLISERPRAAVAILRRMAGITAARLGQTGSLLSQMVQWGEQARKRAVTDEATGLFNRRFYDESLDGILQRADLAGAPVALAMFDLDRFGVLNKTYGQAFGDRLIVEASSVFKRVFGDDDILVRYGGDEFTFIMPGRDAEAGLDRCGAVNAGVRDLRFDEHPDLRLTCSMGLAVYPAQARNRPDLQAAADRALYAAKEAGRDRTEMAR